MIGDDRVRFCPQCKLNVYNFSAMPETEIQRLIARRDGRLCARWYRRADGTILTSDCPVGFRARVKRVSKIAGAALTALLSATPLLGQNQTKPQQPNLIRIENASHGDSGIRVRVEDPTGAVIPNTNVTLLDSKMIQVSMGKTGPNGELQFTGINPGHYRIRAQSPGFAIAEVDTVADKTNDRKASAPLAITLQIGVMGEIVVVTKPSLAHRIFWPFH